MAELQIRKFTREDFPEYKSWFTEPELNRQLGPMDDEWLKYILNEQDGAQYSIFRDHDLVAVLGIKLSDEKRPDYYITDLAVKPNLTGQRIGSITLRKLFELLPLKPGQKWRAFVSVKNPKAKAFLEKNQWICEAATPDEHGMVTLIYAEIPS